MTVEDVEDIIIEFRPYQWVTFKNVSLKPKSKTKVQTEVEKPAEQSEYKTTLPNGVTVKLLGLCEHPSEGKQWWAPDGGHSIQSPYDSCGARPRLAADQTAYEIGLDLPSVKNPTTIAQTLSLVLGLDYDQVFDAASLEPSRSAIYAVVADHVPKHKIDQLEMLKKQIAETYGSRKGNDTPSLAGLTFKPHLKRTYPEGDLAANILGFVNRDGVGYFGVEEKFDDIMAGDKTTRSGCDNAVIQCGQVCGLCASAAISGTADTGRIDFRSRLQIVYRSHCIPNHKRSCVTA